MTKLYFKNDSELKDKSEDDIEFASEIKIGSTIYKRDSKVKKMLESTFFGCKLKNVFSEFREHCKHEYVSKSGLDLDGVEVLIQNSKGKWFTISTSEWGGINFC